MHLDLFQCINLLIKLMLNLEDCSERPLTKHSYLVKCLLLPTRLYERPSLLRFLNYFILGFFLCISILLGEFYYFDRRVLLT